MINTFKTLGKVVLWLFTVAALFLVGSITQTVGAQDKVTICHKGHTITIAQPAVGAHIRNHNDTLGACVEAEPEGDSSSEEPPPYVTPAEEPPTTVPHTHTPSPTPTPSRACEWHMFDPYCN